MLISMSAAKKIVLFEHRNLICEALNLLPWCTPPSLANNRVTKYRIGHTQPDPSNKALRRFWRGMSAASVPICRQRPTTILTLSPPHLPRQQLVNKPGPSAYPCGSPGHEPRFFLLRRWCSVFYRCHSNNYPAEKGTGLFEITRTRVPTNSFWKDIFCAGKGFHLVKVTLSLPSLFPSWEWRRHALAADVKSVHVLSGQVRTSSAACPAPAWSSESGFVCNAISAAKIKFYQGLWLAFRGLDCCLWIQIQARPVRSFADKPG